MATPPLLPALSGAFISTTNYLNVPGASIYYETYGNSGPLVLFIPGGNGHGDVWRAVAKHLAANHTVAIYDRRGFSRSYLSPIAIQDYSKRLETDATDVKLLLEKLERDGLGNGTHNATVLGTSSGAIVALQFLQMFPETAKTVIVHEPPLLTILPDAQALEKQEREIYTIYRNFGIPAAMSVFAKAYAFGATDINQTSSSTSSTPTIDLPDPRVTPSLPNNMQYWFEREFLQYPLSDMSLDDIEEVKKGLVLANGKETSAEAPQVRTNVLMGEKFGMEVSLFAGDHMGYQGHSGQFAGDLVGVLEGRK